MGATALIVMEEGVQASRVSSLVKPHTAQPPTHMRIASPSRVRLSPMPTRCEATAQPAATASRVRRTAGLRCGVTALVAAGLATVNLSWTGGLVAHAAQEDVVLAGVPRVVDGDTLSLGGVKVRLFGMDAPETKQLCTSSSGEEYKCGRPFTPHSWSRDARVLGFHGGGVPQARWRRRRWWRASAGRQCSAR